MEKSKLEEYFVRELPEAFSYELSLHLYLLVSGDKPGVLVLGTSSDQRALLEDLAGEYDLAMEIVERKDQGPGNGFGEPVVMARDRERIERLEDSEGDFLGFSTEAVGRFLGYPEKDVHYYAKTEVPAAASIRQKVGELIEKGKLTEADVRYLEFAPYVPRPTIGAIENAIEEGKRLEGKIRELDRRLGSGVSRQYIEAIAGEAFYSGQF